MPNERSLSTTWDYVPVTIPGRPAGHKDAAPQGSPLRRMEQREWRQPTTVTISYRGGPTARFELVARGRKYFVSGHESLFDVMLSLYGVHDEE